MKYDHFIGNVEFKTVGDTRGVTKCASGMKPVTGSHPAITPDTTDCICDDVINPKKIRTTLKHCHNCKAISNLIIAYLAYNINNKLQKIY